MDDVVHKIKVTAKKQNRAFYCSCWNMVGIVLDMCKFNFVKPWMWMNAMKKIDRWMHGHPWPPLSEVLCHSGHPSENYLGLRCFLSTGDPS